MNIEKYLSTEEFKTRGQLAIETGKTDRVIRQAISNLKKTRPVIYNSQTKGYRLAKDLNSFNTAEEAQEEYDLIQRWLGNYETEERAKEVLQDILKHAQESISYHAVGSTVWQKHESVYEMSAE